jgi:putative MATE family efflux protein
MPGEYFYFLRKEVSAMSTIQPTADGKEKQSLLILNENLWKMMYQLSWPAIIAMVLYGLNAVIAAVFVGRYVGETALAGVSVAYPLTQISLGLGSLIGVGAGAALSIAIGRKDLYTQKRLMGNVNYISIIVTVVYMVLGLLFSTQLVKMMGGEGEALSLGDSYFRITVWGAFFWIYGLAANMIVRAEGKMKSAAVVMGIGLAADVMFNYLLVAVLDFGVEGAAWATNIGMFVYTLLGWIYFGKGFASFKTKAFAIYPDAATLKSIMGLGLSSFIMNFMNLVQAVIVFNALSRYGTIADVAFYGVVFRVFTFLLTPIFGLMRALQPVIGINYGAGNYDRVIKSYKIFTFVSMLLTLPFWLISMINPQWILGLMLPDQVFSAAQFQYFRINMAVLPLLSMIFMAMTFFPSIDKGKPAAMIGIARQLVFYVPVMLVLPRIMGVSGVYWGSLVIDAIVVLWTVILVRKEFVLLRTKGGASSESASAQLQI